MEAKLSQQEADATKKLFNQWYNEVGATLIWRRGGEEDTGFETFLDGLVSEKIINDGKICKTCAHYDKKYYICNKRQRDTGEEQWCGDWAESSLVSEDVRNHHRGVCFRVNKTDVSEDEVHPGKIRHLPKETDNEITKRVLTDMRGKILDFPGMPRNFRAVMRYIFDWLNKKD